MQIVDDKVLLVRTPNPKPITSQIEKSKVLTTKDGVSEVAVYWGIKEARMLAKMKAPNVPSPILRDYSWTGRLTPFDHQKTTASFLTLYDRAFCFNEQGTGKTASVIWAADYMMKRNEVKRVLILCPLSIMDSAWRQDLFKFAMHRSCSVAHGTAKQRAKIIKAGAEFVAINFDGLAVVEEEIINGGFDLIVVDEANAYKNPQTNRWKVLNRIVNAITPRLWMLTGTPAAQSPVDAYGLAKLVNPEGCP
jgi:SNF2 family DNA or RNA helicase